MEEHCMPCLPSDVALRELTIIIEITLIGEGQQTHPKNLISVSCVLCRGVPQWRLYGHQIGDHLYVACASIEIQIISHPF